MLKGGLPTATTYYKKHKISKGETIAQSLKERFDYGQNPDKTEGGELISSYGCDHMTADAEFLLSTSASRRCSRPVAALYFALLKRNSASAVMWSQP